MPIEHYRVTVRGRFAHLDDDARARLRADAAQHDALSARFTPDGTFVYDGTLAAFSFRFEVDVDEPLRSDADVAAELIGLERAAAYLAQRGVGHRDLRATVDNVGEMLERTRRLR